MLNLTLTDPYDAYEELLFYDLNEKNLNNSIHANYQIFCFMTKHALILTLNDPHNHNTRAVKSCQKTHQCNLCRQQRLTVYT